MASIIERMTLNVIVRQNSKCPLNNGVSIVQKLVVKLLKTLTRLFPPVAKPLSKCLSVWEFDDKFLNDGHTAVLEDI